MELRGWTLLHPSNSQELVGRPNQSINAINSNSGLPIKMSKPGPCMSHMHHVALVEMIDSGLAVSLLSPANDRARYHTITRCGRHLARKRGV